MFCLTENDPTEPHFETRRESIDGNYYKLKYLR